MHRAQPQRPSRSGGRHRHGRAPPPPGLLPFPPPPTVRIVPVVNDDASVAKYTAAPTISRASPARRSGKVSVRSASTSMSQFLAMLVRNGPGMIALTRTFGPNASANAIVIALTPALAAAYGTMSAVGRTAPV